MNTLLIEKFAPVLWGSRAPVVCDPGLLMDASGPVKVYYAPFEYINSHARIVLVGFTPGPTRSASVDHHRDDLTWSFMTVPTGWHCTSLQE